MKDYLYAEHEDGKKYIVFEVEIVKTRWEAEQQARTIAIKRGLELAGGCFTSDCKPYDFKDNYIVIKVPKNTKKTLSKSDERASELERGTIRGFGGSWGSGIGYLQVEKEDGTVESIPCENSTTVRALEDAFGDVITDGHTANGKGFIGKEIFYCWDEMGLLLGGFTPVEEARPELIEKYEQQHATL